MSPTTTDAVLSLRRVRPRPWMANLFAAEDHLVEAGAALLTIEQSGGVGSRFPWGHRITDRLGQRMGLHAHQVAEEFEPADHLLVLINDSDDLHVLDSLEPSIEQLARHRALVQTECWPADVVNGDRLIRSVYERFDDVFCTIESSVPVLQRLHPRVHTLLQFADVGAHPPTTRFDRPIDVINYGRRDERQHQLLRRWAADAPERWYQFDTYTDMLTSEPQEHRRAMGRFLSNARVSVCNHAAFSIPERTQGAFEAGPRFFESLAGGAAILGRLPTASLFVEASADWPGLVDMSFDDDELPREFVELMADDDRRRAVHLAHRDAALRHHDHSHRLAEIYERLGWPVPAGVHARIDQLASLAGDQPGSAAR